MNLKNFIPLFAICLSLYACSGTKKVSEVKKDTTAKEDKKSTSNVNRLAIIKYARTFIGTPYKYGGNKPSEGFDCSGYVKYVYNNFNVIVPRITKDYAQFGKRITLDNVKIGDLILFSLYDDKNTIGHIGIVSSVDNHKILFLHAASGRNSRKVMESELIGTHKSRMLFITRVIE